MATKKNTKQVETPQEVPEATDEADEAANDAWETEDPTVGEILVEDDLETEVDEDSEGDADETPAEEGETLDALEAEELEMLTEDEESEVIPVDEQAEMRAIRREAIALDTDAESPGSDEFVCQSCFLVKRTSQLANKSKKICSDCAA